MTKRLLITGGAGFIGHHVIEHFLEKTDWEIISLDRLDYSGNLNRLDNVVSKYPAETRKRVKIVWHDLKAEIQDLTQNLIGDVNIILHLAAASHVDRSITHPMEFLMDNTVGTVNVLNFARKLKNLERLIYFSTDEIFGIAPNGVSYGERDRYNSTNPYSASKAAAEEFCVAYENTYKMPIYITHCHDETTKCWSEKGIVSIDQLQVGDKVWTLADNKNLTLEPILEIVNSPYEGEMINFVSNKTNLSVTPNHRMVTKTRNEAEWSIRYASDMFDRRDRQYIPLSGDWNYNDSEEIDLAEHIDFSKLHFNANVPNKTLSKKSFMRFVGWYVTEGFCRVQRRSGPSICQKKNHFFDEIEESMKIFGINITRSMSKSGTTVFELNSNVIGEFCKTNFGASSHEKRLPQWIKNSSKENLSHLFDAMMKGDGTIHKSYRRFYTSSYQLAQDFAEIAIKLGHSCGIKERETWNPNRTKKSLSYYVSLRKSIGGIESNHMSRSQYKGNIWCVRTSSGNFFVEREGHISCSGNTMNVFGERQHPEKFIPMSIRKIRNGETIGIHSDPSKTIPGSRFYIHAKDVAEAMYFLLHLNEDQKKLVYTPDYGGAKCPKFNVVGKEEIDNLQLVQYIADAQNKDLKYEMIDFHTSRPGHDLRYALSGDFMRQLGWEPRYTLQDRIKEVVSWSLENPEWIEL
jgi:dTDP-D-glucose 4,6-dehydratase